MDEMGDQEWAGSVTTICFVPHDTDDEILFYPVAHTGKRITLIACVATDTVTFGHVLSSTAKPVGRSKGYCPIFDIFFVSVIHLTQGASSEEPSSLEM
jgi:hypothetical protein